MVVVVVFRCVLILGVNYMLMFMFSMNKVFVILLKDRDVIVGFG